ncbi:MAG: sugar phosphate isomerase/epimerase family protein [Phycisphaerae bacterium]|jgi:sugar phosphate isomerase/epimerase
MILQNFEKKNKKIHESFLKLKAEPERFRRRLIFSWSNWGFGMEPFQESAERLEKAGIKYIELHGNHYGRDLGYKASQTLKILDDCGLKVSGICGIFSADNDLSSRRGIQRQSAIDYLKRELDFAEEVKASYILVVPAAVGRPVPYDDMEFQRSAETLRVVADDFLKKKIKAAIEPIRSDEVSIVHTISEAIKYIDAVGHPGVRHINADVYHMQSSEVHTGEAILDAGDMLVNLHLADSNRGALGDGSLDLDSIIKALYVAAYNREDRFVTLEPLGAGGNPYSAMFEKPDPKMLDRLVLNTVDYFKEREEQVISVCLEHS